MLTKLYEGDAGASALLVASVMVLLMGLAAVVLDGGFGFSERRQAQSAVDFGSLAALQAAVSCETVPSCSETQAVDNGATEAMAVVAANLPGRTLDWAPGICVDANRPAEYTRVSTLTDCVSFTENFDQARVHLPDDNLDTTFGNLIGTDVITVVAEAEAGSTLQQESNVIPLTPTGQTGGEVCLFSNQAPQAEDPCDGAASGFYGYLDIALYGKDNPDGSVSTPSTCNQGSTNDRIPINLTKGGDHSLVVHNSGDPIVDDFAACPDTQEDINQVRVETGSPTGAITDGLLDGTSGAINGQPYSPEVGRLACQTDPDLSDPYVWSCNNSVRGLSVDDTPLWEFLTGGCTVSNHSEMVACLTPGNSPIFAAAIADHPRFAAVPVLKPNGPNPNDPAPTGPGSYRIKEFVPVWLSTIYMDCNANTCDTVFSPGAASAPDPCEPSLAGTRNCGWADTSGPDDVEGLLAFALDLDMLPDEITDTFPGSETERDYALIE